MKTRRARLLPRLLAPLALATLFLLAPAAHAGGDDFEFGLALADMGRTGDRTYFKYARRVFNRVINDKNATDAEKDLCRYGLAKMKQAEALGARLSGAKYAEVLSLFNEAISNMESFVERNAKHKRAVEAKLLVGTTRLAFVQWAREDLLPDPERMVEMGTNLNEVQKDAQGMVRGAIRYFDGLRKGHDSMNATNMAELAQYYWVLCQYYLALIHPEGSEAAKEAFTEAANHLEGFIMLNDGELLAIYAQDIYGLTYWELAKIAGAEGKEDEQVAQYRRAVEWFETCIESPNEGPDWERVIANGYYHLAQACLEAGPLGTEDFHRIGSNYLGDMEARHPTIHKQDNGLRAMIQWAKIESARDRPSEAIDIAQRAGEYAKSQGKGYLEAVANRTLRIILTGGGRRSGSALRADPAVLKRVADDFFNEQKWGDAIAAYQRVIATVPRTRANVDTYLIPTWERISGAHRQQEDLLAAAIAYEPIHELWVDGLVRTTGGSDDPNMVRVGDIRQRAQRLWKELYDTTGSPIYRRQYTEIRDSFRKDYPEHQGGVNTAWNAANDKFTQARKAKDAGDSKWRSLLREAEEAFREVSGDAASQRQDAAFVALIHAQYLRENWQGILNSVEDAFAYWNSPAAQAQAKKFPTIASRRKGEMGKAGFWKAEALWRLERWDDLIKSLDSWHVEYAGLKGNGPYFSGTLGHLVMAYIGKGDIEGADKPYRRLLKEDPEYFRLPKITFALAQHFNEKAEKIDAKRKEARAKLNGTTEAPMSGARTRLRITARNEFRTIEILADRQAGLEKLRELVEVYERKEKEGTNTIPKPDYDDAKKRIPELVKEIAELTEKANRLRAEREALEQEVADLTGQVKDLAQQLYDPIVDAANYFKDWDDVLVASGQQRIAKNVSIFADRFFMAAQLRPEIAENWEKARSLYESHMKLPDADQEGKHEAIGRLGTIYARLAEAAPEGSEERATLVQKALDRLQSSVATIPENNDIVVGLLAGDVVVIPWGLPGEPTYRFPLPRIKTVDEFKKAVNELGRGTPIPRFETDVENRRYENAVRAFQRHVNQVMKPAEIERTVKSFEIAGFDMPFYRMHAESGIDFRLALAWIYGRSEQFENMTKAINLAGSVVQGRYAAEEISAEWWEAQVTKLTALVSGAELLLKEPGSPRPTAPEWVERASDMIRGLKTSAPGLGDEVRPQTRGQLKKLLSRLEAARGRLRLPALNLILDKLPGSR